MTETEADPSRCPECDGPYLWGGMSWNLDNHTGAFHAARRRMYLKALDRLMHERMAVRMGHEITIRFAGKQAWYECTCAFRGTTFVGSTAGARQEAHQHLFATGQIIHRPLLMKWLAVNG